MVQLVVKRVRLGPVLAMGLLVVRRDHLALVLAMVAKETGGKAMAAVEMVVVMAVAAKSAVVILRLARIDA
jgi:hypothetical protein